MSRGPDIVASHSGGSKGLHVFNAATENATNVNIDCHQCASFVHVEVIKKKLIKLKGRDDSSLL